MRIQNVRLPAVVFVIFLTIALASFPPRVHAAGSIGITGVAWDHREITVKIVPNATQSWYTPSLANHVGDGVRLWSDTITVFTSLYGYTHLRSLEFTVYVQGVNATSAESRDVEFYFFKSLPGDALGVTSYNQTLFGGKIIAPVTIKLAAQTSTGISLNENDIITVAAHEFAHALGLDHANQDETDLGNPELMYERTSINSQEPVNPSTLDLYALSVVYDWVKDGSFDAPGRQTVSLPSNIPTYDIVSLAESDLANQVIHLTELVTQLRQQVMLLTILLAVAVIGAFGGSALGLVYGASSTKRKLLSDSPILAFRSPLTDRAVNSKMASWFPLSVDVQSYSRHPLFAYGIFKVTLPQGVQEYKSPVLLIGPGASSLHNVILSPLPPPGTYDVTVELAFSPATGTAAPAWSMLPALTFRLVVI